MKRLASILIALLLLVIPANAHRRYIAYTTVPTTDSTSGATFTAIAGLNIDLPASMVAIIRCYIVTSSTARTTGALIGVTMPTTGSPTITGIIEPMWPELVSENIGSSGIERGGVDGTCAAGLTCVNNPSTPFVDGERVRFTAAGDMGQLVGLVATVQDQVTNFFNVAIDSSLFTPWAINARIERVPPGIQTFGSPPANYTPNSTIVPTSPAGRVINEMRVLFQNGSVAGTFQPTINASNSNATVTAEVGSWCEYSYEIGQ